MITKEVEKGKKCNLCFFTIQLFHSLGRPLFISLSTFPLLPSICFHLVPPSSPTYFLPYFLTSLPPPFNILPYILHVSETSSHFSHLTFFGLSNVLSV